MKKIIFLLVFIIHSLVFAQTTGKIAGRVVDAKTNEALPGVQIVIVAKWINGKEVKLDKCIGATSDLNGNYYIINIPPGYYSVEFQMIGYKTVKYEKVRVSVNRTKEINVKLQETILSGEPIVVEAKTIEIKKDQTSSIRNISSTEIKRLPIESVHQVVALQPGVVAGHFRGGRSGEVSYLINGIDVSESFSHSGRSIDVNPSAVQEVDVITGTFNAEYGRAMSGVVNIVTKEGGDRFNGTFYSNIGTYLTNHKDKFIGLKDFDIRSKDIRMTLSGPIIKNYVNFFVNTRYRHNLGHLNGIYRFKVDDYSDFHGDSTQWYSEHNGDNSYVPMNWSKNFSYFGNLTYKPLPQFKASLLSAINDDRGQGYDHFYKYNPYGRATSYRKSYMFALLINHSISNKMFYEFKLSYIKNYNGNYVYKNPYDPRYVHDVYSRSFGVGFSTGGQQKHHIERTMKDYNFKYDITWQLNNNHSLKSGFLYSYHILDNKSFTIRNKYYGEKEEFIFYYDSTANKRIYPYYEPEILPDSSTYTDIYKHKPFELSCYIQDKMEFEYMVINLGVRLDYFSPNTYYPSQWRNPANQLSFPNNPEKMSKYLKATPKYQISPRLGISYQLGKTALLHFAYGHFFQMPPLYAIYQNHSHMIPPFDFAVVMGNPQINAQKTVQYEIGLWQKLMEGMNLELTVYYRDIYNLLSAKVITTFNQIRYGLYSNKDYGNVRGLEAKYDINYKNLFINLNYTYQYTRGNADSPTFTFSRAGSRMDPVNRLIPMSWDQRHTLNISIGYYQPNYGASMTIQYNSGTPYTWAPLPESPLSQINLFPNNDYMPAKVNVDLNAHYNIFDFNGIKGRINLLVYNLFDRLNETGVYGTTGRAYTSIVRENDIKNHKSDFNDYWDIIKNPGMFSEPRLIKVGLDVTF